MVATSVTVGGKGFGYASCSVPVSRATKARLSDSTSQPLIEGMPLLEPTKRVPI